jgi:hypothetical protein
MNWRFEKVCQKAWVKKHRFYFCRTQLPVRESKSDGKFVYLQDLAVYLGVINFKYIENQ